MSSGLRRYAGRMRGGAAATQECECTRLEPRGEKAKRDTKQRGTHTRASIGRPGLPSRGRSVPRSVTTTSYEEVLFQMAQKVTGYVKLQIPAGQATPAPPVGPALGQHGVNIAAFTKEFNERTKKDMGLIIPVVITVYADRSFTFITKTPPAAVLIKKACGIESGSGVPNKTKVATLSKADLQKIAETKMPDLNAASLEAAMSMVAGTARSMGVLVEE